MRSKNHAFVVEEKIAFPENIIEDITGDYVKQISESTVKRQKVTVEKKRKLKSGAWILGRDHKTGRQKWMWPRDKRGSVEQLDHSQQDGSTFEIVSRLVSRDHRGQYLGRCPRPDLQEEAMYQRHIL